MGIIKLSDVKEELHNRLSDDDINLSSSLSTQAAKFNRLLIEMNIGHKCKFCSESITTLPVGNYNADIMFIVGTPDVNENAVRTAMFSARGMLLNTIISKLSIHPSRVYITHNPKSLDDSPEHKYACFVYNIVSEITIVNPKIIITLGEDIASMTQDILFNNPNAKLEDVRGKQYVWTINDNPDKFIYHTFDPQIVLDKAGAMYNKYKADLWNDIKNYTKLSGLS